jgi:hypothetical protein
MPKRSSPRPGGQAVAEDGALAVSYLRVSTKEQAQRGGRDEGFSLPAQREANQRKETECQRRADKRPTRTLMHHVEGSSKTRGVELRGLEPLTPCMQSRCATSCAIAPRFTPFRVSVVTRSLVYRRSRGRRLAPGCPGLGSMPGPTDIRPLTICSRSQ